MEAGNRALGGARLVGWPAPHSAVSPDWLDSQQGAGREFLREVAQVKNIWAPAGE